MRFASVVALFVLFGWLAEDAASQISIGPDKLPSAGDVFIAHPMDTAGVFEGTAGANKSWNFAGLTSSALPETIRYVNAAATPYVQQFPNASLASVIDDGGFITYAYFSTASSKLTFYGSAGEEFIIQYDDPELQMSTPLHFNDQYSDEFRGVMNGEGFSVRTTGSLNVINDSYGMLVLPGGASMQAARVKFVRQNFDTTFVNGIPLMTSSLTITSYEWFSASAKFPVLQIAYYVHVTNGSTTRIKKVDYHPVAPTSVDERKKDGVAATFRLDQNFPNPFNPATTIGFQLPQSGKVSLKVYTLLGQEVATLLDEELGNGIYAIPFDAGNLASGTYVYRLQVGDAVQTKKLTLLK
ncbi:MAG: T9SS type A sorting domain-containing protein [Bacteroidetes bacterium]|nr:T9SS type A sorting domain-containing protein [Bacteroidota bacterium]MCW5895187.1 T9SS type A sorting domain-containing protein [Bacteroidota bacterium]